MVPIATKAVSEKMGPVHVALYVRVSSDKQAKKEDGSLDTQLDRLKSFVEYKKTSGQEWNITEQVVEGEKDGMRHGRSAKNTDRPGLQRLMELSRAGLIDVVVITKIDRISRSVIDFLLLVAELDRHRVRVVSLYESIDLTTPAGRLQTTIMIALAQHEREVIAARVKEKVAWRAEKGLPLGRPPIGYVLKDKMYVIDEAHAQHVRAADALYLERESADVIVREFRERGYRTPNGKFYTKPMICRMLRNPVYAGKVEYGEHSFDAQWKPIRSWDTHVRIGRQMDRNNRRKRSSKRQPKDFVYLLQGLLRCGQCGFKMSPKPGTGRSGDSYHYYHCGNADKSAGLNCAKRYVPADSLDRAVLEFMKRLHVKPELVRAFAEKANESTSGTVQKIREDHGRVRSQLQSVKAKLDHLADAVADGGKAAMRTLKDRIEALEVERTELEETESRLQFELEAEQNQEIAAKDQVQTLAVFNDLVTNSEEHPERIKALIPRFVDYVVFHEEAKGEGQLEVALFPTPVAMAPDVEFEDGVNGSGRRFAGESQMVDLMGFEPTTSAMRVQRSPS